MQLYLLQCILKNYNKIPGSFVAIIVVTFLFNFEALLYYRNSIWFNSTNNIVPHSTHRFFKHTMYIIKINHCIISGIESLLSVVVSDGMIGSKHQSNTELVAQGIANVVTPFFGGIPATGAIARTATNVKNVARTPVAGIIHAITLLCIMLFVEIGQLIPMSCLAGILIVVSYNMSEWRSFVNIFAFGIRYSYTCCYFYLQYL